jgi:SAM-dependent methyltransferase
MCRTRMPYDVEQVRRLGETTIAYYDRFARAFWEGTRHHDVSQNYAAFLNAIESDPPYSILDLGCGPGRDLSHFRSLGHEAVGLDGSQQFVAIARAYSGCEVLHQDLLVIVETWSERGCWLIESSVTVAGGHAAMIFSFARGRASRKVSIGVLPKHQRP